MFIFENEILQEEARVDQGPVPPETILLIGEPQLSFHMIAHTSFNYCLVQLQKIGNERDWPVIRASSAVFPQIFLIWYENRNLEFGRYFF